MNQKGLTLIELLIVIVVLAILASFSLVAIGNIIENAKEDSFVNTANSMLVSAKNAYNQTDDLWNDDKATLQELEDGGYIEGIDNDPWGLPYDKINSVVTLVMVVSISDEVFLSNTVYIGTDALLKVKLISETATIGFDTPLAEFDDTDVVYLNGNSSGIAGLIQTITGTLRTPVSGDNNEDDITVENVSSGGDITTFDGDDTVSIGNDFTGNATVDTGSGNDTVVIENDMRQNVTLDTGDGDDTIDLQRWLRGYSIIDAGDGADTINIGEVRYHTQTIAGAGNDTVIIDSVLGNFVGSVVMGDGDDDLTISDSGTPFSGVTGTFTGGAGNDTLTLLTVDFARWAQISHMFTGFETIILSDGTVITP